MAKRFNDTEKYKNKWFRTLPVKMKCFWDYICSQCDCVGMWDADFEQASFHIGEEITEDEVLRYFKTQIMRYNEKKFFITDFIKFQYGKLSQMCKPHQKYIAMLQDYGIKIDENQRVYIKGIHTLQEEEEEKEKEMEKEKEKEEGVFFSDTMRLIQIYDSILGDKKGIFKGIDLPPRAKKAFLESSGFMPSEKNWIDLFELVKNSEHLCESSWCNLTWLVDYDNAMKVLQGAFDSFNEKATIDREFTVEDIRKHLEATK